MKSSYPDMDECRPLGFDIIYSRNSGETEWRVGRPEPPSAIPAWVWRWPGETDWRPFREFENWCALQNEIRMAEEDHKYLAELELLQEQT